VTPSLGSELSTATRRGREGDHPEEVDDSTFARRAALVKVLSLVDKWTREHQARMAEMKVMRSSQAGLCRYAGRGESRADDEALAAPECAVGATDVSRRAAHVCLSSASASSGSTRNRRSSKRAKRWDDEPRGPGSTASVVVGPSGR